MKPRPFRRTITSKELNRVVSSFTIYKFVKAITTHYKDTDAFRLGVIDARGNYLKNPIGIISPFDRLIINLKVLLDKIPDPRIRSQLSYLTTGIGLIAEESSKYGADPYEVFESIMDYFQGQGIDLDQYLEEAKKEKPQAETVGHLEHVGELMYRGLGSHAIEHLSATHSMLAGKPVQGHNLSYKADGSVSLVFGKHQGKPYVQYKGKNSPAFFSEKEITDYAQQAGKPHLVAPFISALKAASHPKLAPNRSYQADAILRDSDTTMKGNLLRYKLPSPSTRSSFAVHSEIDTDTGKKISSNPDLSGLSTDEHHFAPLSLSRRKFKLGSKSSKKLGKHISKAKQLLSDKDVSGFLDEVSKHEDPSSKTGARRLHFKRFGQAVQEKRHPRTVAGFVAFSKAEIAKEKNKKQQARLQSHMDYGIKNKKALAKTLRAHEHIDRARGVIFNTITTEQMPLSPAEGGTHEGIVSELPGRGQVKFVPPEFTIANKGQKDKFTKKKLKEENMKARDILRKIVEAKISKSTDDDEDVEIEYPETEREKAYSSNLKGYGKQWSQRATEPDDLDVLGKKPNVLEFEPSDYKEKHSKMLNDLVSALIRKKQSNVLNEDGGGDAGDEEDKKIKNRIGSGKIAGLWDPREASKQPTDFKNMLKKFLKKNAYKKED